MAKNIVQKIVFKNTTTHDLYELYMNSKKHAQATGAAAKLSGKEGGTYRAFDGYITGINLCLLKDKLIVQTWRTVEWDEGDSDAVITILLEAKGKNVTLHMVHANLPDKHADSIHKGWHLYYWKPWKQYLAGKPIPASGSM